jgi:hypothetical protein
MSPAAAVMQWVEEVVVGYGLCPFAAKPLRDGQVSALEIEAEDIPTAFEVAMTQVQGFLAEEPVQEKAEEKAEEEEGRRKKEEEGTGLRIQDSGFWLEEKAEEEEGRRKKEEEGTGLRIQDSGFRKEKAEAEGEEERRKKEEGSSVHRMSPKLGRGSSDASRTAAPVTTLLVFSRALDDFHTFLDFVATLEDVLAETGADQLVQLAHFHPDYQFADLSYGDAANRTNRAPYPVVQLLRVAGVARAIEHYPDVEAIPERNIRRMREVFGRGG